MLIFCFFGKKKPKTDSLKTSNYTIFVSPTSMDNISHWTFDLQLYFNSILTFHLSVNLYPFKNQPFALYNKQYYLSLGENNMEKKDNRSSESPLIHRSSSKSNSRKDDGTS